MYLPQPEPDDPAMLYEYYYFNTCRIQDGLIAETWPGTNKLSLPRGQQPNEPSPGSVAVGSNAGAADLAINKRLVTEFYRLVFDAHDAGAVKDLVAADYQQHAKYLPRGAPGWKRLSAACSRTDRCRCRHHRSS